MGNKTRFVPITRKVAAIIVISLVLGIGAITFFFARSLSTTIESGTADNMTTQSDILYQAIEAFMLPGEATLAVDFFDGIANITPDYDIRLYRTTGVRAFSDNQTIERVNEVLGFQGFALKDDPDDNPMRIVGNPNFERVARPPTEEVFVTETDPETGVTILRAYKPLLNLPVCTECHGSDHTIRGVIDIRNDITDSVIAQRDSIIISSGFFLGIVLFLTIVLTFFLRRSVIRPVQKIGQVCALVTDGDFDVRVDYSANDEIGRLGGTVNKMVTGLHERFELSKFVSTSTIASLTEDRQAKDANITMFFTDIRGFTSYSEQNNPETVVTSLNEIMVFQSDIIQDEGGDIDKYVGDEIFALFTGENQEERACRAAFRIVEAMSQTKDPRFFGLEVGVGINRGGVIVGMVGSDQRADFTVIGDNVNLAARLCSAAGPGEVIVTETLLAAVVDTVKAEGPYSMRVKGKKEPVRVYKIVAPDTSRSENAASRIDTLEGGSE